MKRFLMYSLVALLGMATLSCSREDGADGINGINGIDGINGKTILSGKGEPSTSLGTIGDFYLNLDNYNLYGPKSEQGWGNPISLIGAKGDKGEDGKDGADGIDGKDAPKIWTGETAPTSSIGNEGDFYLDLKNKVLYGPKTNGNWGSGIVLGGGNSSLKGNYVLSADGTALLHWFDRDIKDIDMEADAELRNVTRIGAEVFSGQVLNTIVLPKGLKYIGRRAFMNNNLTSVEIPDGVISIDSTAFKSNHLTSVIIPNSVTSIGGWAFSRNQLTSVVIPNSVTSIGDGAFSSNGLTSIVIPNSVTSIGDYAFSSNQLTSVSIPNGVTSIGDGAFAYNINLTSITMEGTIPPNVIFFNKDYKQGIVGNEYYFNKDLIIYVPLGSVDAYKNHSGWSMYADRIVGK